MKRLFWIYHSNFTLRDTMLQLFVTEFHNCSFFSVCGDTWGHHYLCAKCVFCDLTGDMARTFHVSYFLFHFYCTMC